MQPLTPQPQVPDWGTRYLCSAETPCTSAHCVPPPRLTLPVSSPRRAWAGAIPGPCCQLSPVSVTAQSPSLYCTSSSARGSPRIPTRVQLQHRVSLGDHTNTSTNMSMNTNTNINTDTGTNNNTHSNYSY